MPPRRSRLHRQVVPLIHDNRIRRRAVPDKTDLLESLLADRILVLDGAMGTQIQALRLDERAVRGERFAGHHKDLKNFVDILCLTQPAAITDIHRRYLEAGADIVETNTFGASPIGLARLIRRVVAIGRLAGAHGEADTGFLAAARDREDESASGGANGDEPSRDSPG